MTLAEILDKLTELANTDDEERAHYVADKLLIEALKALTLKTLTAPATHDTVYAIVRAYNAVPKWYA